MDDVFRCGWLHGRAWGEVSPREAEHALRVLRIEVTGDAVDRYIQGSVDGAAGDTWRLEYAALAQEGGA